MDPDCTYRQMDADNTPLHTRHKHIPSLLKGTGCVALLLMLISLAAACSEETRRTTAVQTGDSLPFMHSVGVSTLISDSGVIRYHLVAEQWDIHTPDDEPATWTFLKGLLMLRLDENLDVDLYVQADTAFLHKQNMWELRGRVRIRNVQGTRFNTEELFWDLNKHEMWNHAPMTIISPERTLEGTEFRSNEQMTRYSVANSVGDFPMSDADGTGTQPADSASTQQTDSTATKTVPAPTQHTAPTSTQHTVSTATATTPPKVTQGKPRGIITRQTVAPTR